MNKTKNYMGFVRTDHKDGKVTLSKIIEIKNIQNITNGTKDIRHAMKVSGYQYKPSKKDIQFYDVDHVQVKMTFVKNQEEESK